MDGKQYFTVLFYSSQSIGGFLHSSKLVFILYCERKHYMHRMLEETVCQVFCKHVNTIEHDITTSLTSWEKNISHICIVVQVPHSKNKKK